jgi:hypothetical protein
VLKKPFTIDDLCASRTADPDVIAKKLFEDQNHLRSAVGATSL